MSCRVLPPRITLIKFLFLVFFAVQLRGEAAGPEGELDEATPGGDHDQDGGAGQGIHEGQAEGKKKEKGQTREKGVANNRGRSVGWRDGRTDGMNTAHRTI